MRNIGLVAFTVTTGVLVPAVVNLLDAGHQQLVKLAAPDETTFELDGVEVKASLDRKLLDPGGALTVTLTASHTTKKQLRVGVLALGSNGSEGDRVQSPPNGVAHEIVTLDFKDGVATRTVSFPLKGAIQSEWRPFGHYTVLVAAPKTTARLESLRGRSHFLGDVEEGIPELNRAGNQFMEAYSEIGREETEAESPYAAKKIARLEAHTRPNSGAVALAVPETARLGDEVAVTVTVKNPGKRAMAGLAISLVEHAGIGDPYAYPDESAKQPARLVVSPEKVTVDLAGKATMQVQFKVKGNVAGVIGLYANANCSAIQYDDETGCKDVQALQIGTFDAIEIQSIESGIPTVAAR